MGSNISTMLSAGEAVIENESINVMLLHSKVKFRGAQFLMLNYIFVFLLYFSYIIRLSFQCMFNIKRVTYFTNPMMCGHLVGNEFTLSTH